MHPWRIDPAGYRQRGSCTWQAGVATGQELPQERVSSRTGPLHKSLDRSGVRYLQGKADSKSQALLLFSRHLRGLLGWIRITSHWGRAASGVTF
jgi:hypothetical protein